MPKTTKAQRAKHEKLIAASDAANTAIYNVVYPRCDVVFSKCLELASPELVEARVKAFSELWDFEAMLIHEGRAWRSSTGSNLYFN